MGSSKWIKLPDGRSARPGPDTLALFLADHDGVLRRPASPLPVQTSGSRSGARETDYSTESFDMSLLAGREITVFGAGSVGSHAVHALGPARLRINSVDAGAVHPRHTQGGRTAYNPTHIGLKKVDALKQRIERDFPGTVINPLPYHTTEIPDTQIKATVAESLVVVLAIDDPSEILRISDIVYPITELVQPAMHREGRSGHIVTCFPFVTPCLRCSLGVNEATDIHRLDSEPASGPDIAVVAQQAARIALDIAYSKVTGQPITRWDPTKNLIFIANTRQDTNPDGPGLHFEASQKRPGCPVCDPRTAA